MLGFFFMFSGKRFYYITHLGQSSGESVQLTKVFADPEQWEHCQVRSTPHTFAGGQKCAPSYRGEMQQTSSSTGWKSRKINHSTAETAGKIRCVVSGKIICFYY